MEERTWVGLERRKHAEMGEPEASLVLAENGRLWEGDGSVQERAHRPQGVEEGPARQPCLQQTSLDHGDFGLCLRIISPLVMGLWVCGCRAYSFCRPSSGCWVLEGTPYLVLPKELQGISSPRHGHTHHAQVGLEFWRKRVARHCLFCQPPVGVDVPPG